MGRKIGRMQALLLAGRVSHLSEVRVRIRLQNLTKISFTNTITYCMPKVKSFPKKRFWSRCNPKTDGLGTALRPCWHWGGKTLCFVEPRARRRWFRTAARVFLDGPPASIGTDAMVCQGMRVHEAGRRHVRGLPKRERTQFHACCQADAMCAWCRRRCSSGS